MWTAWIANAKNSTHTHTRLINVPQHAQLASGDFGLRLFTATFTNLSHDDVQNAAQSIFQFPISSILFHSERWDHIQMLEICFKASLSHLHKEILRPL